MDSPILGLVLDSSVLIAAERRNLTVVQAIENVRKVIGEVPVVLSAVTVAEIGQGIYRANAPEVRQRRRSFLDDLKATISDLPADGSDCRNCRSHRRRAGGHGHQSSVG